MTEYKAQRMSHIHTLIAAIAVWTFVISAPVALGKNPVAPNENLQRTKIGRSSSAKHLSIILAENENTVAADKEKTTPAVQGHASENSAEPETNRRGPSATAKTAPLKPFEPSEEIAAEQAVDFPADI